VEVVLKEEGNVVDAARAGDEGLLTTKESTDVAQRFKRTRRRDRWKIIVTSIF
jgi:hypothetical protein